MEGFNQTDIAYILALAKGLGGCSQHGHWFRGLTEEAITLESIDAENDFLQIHVCAIQKREVDAESIVPGRKKIVYAVFVPVTTVGSYWEPDDTDLAEIGTFDCLSEAFSEFYAQFAQDFARDNALAVSYEFMQPVEEEV